MDERLKLIADTYGYDAQSRQLIEEMAELTQAINKFWRKQLDCGKKQIRNVPFGNPEERCIVEEIADVEICIEQLKYFFICNVEVKHIKEQKLERQIERIENHE